MFPDRRGGTFASDPPPSLDSDAATLRIDKDALFELLRYRPHTSQAEVHRSSARFRLMACGARFGKSTCAAMEAACALLQPCQNSMGWVVAPTLELTKHIVDRTRIALLQHLPHRVLEDDSRGHRLVVQNLGGGRSELRGKTADNPTSLLGEALHWLIVDEAAKLREEIWSSYLAPRLVDHAGWALLISTPRGMNWFFEAWMRGQKNRDPEYASWRAPTVANPHLAQSIVEAERRRAPGEVFAQEFEAVFLGEHTIACETCGGPSAEVTGLLVTRDLELQPRCSACGRYVDGDGRTVVGRCPNGEASLCVIDGGPGARFASERTQRQIVEQAAAARS